MTRVELKVVVKLVLAHARHRPGRILLTSLSTIAAACVVVWVVSGYDSLVGQFGSMGSEYVGRYELLLLPRKGEVEGEQPVGPGGRQNLYFSKEFPEAIRRDPDVALVDPIFETTLRAGKVGDPNVSRVGNIPPPPQQLAPPPNTPTQASSGPVIMGGLAQLRNQSRVPTVVGTDSAEPLHKLLRGNWFEPQHPERLEGALTHDAAEFLEVQIGDEVGVMGSDRKESRIKIVAILEQPKRLPGPKFMVGLPPTRPGALPGGPVSHALYVPIRVAEKLTASPMKISYAGVILKSGVRVDDWLGRWSSTFVSGSPVVEVRTPEKVDGEVANSTTFETLRAQAYSATGISLLAALFIIFTTLSMGVDERIRQFAMLRAIAFSKWQIATMVTLESLILGLIGWSGGLLAGWGLLNLMRTLKPETLSEGAELGTWCIVLSGACALGGSLAAAIIPAWRATSVSPLEAMAPRLTDSCGRLPGWTFLVGLVLISINPLVVFYIPMPDTSRYLASAALGCTTMVVGFLLLTPLAVILTERTLGPVLAWLLRLNSRLLATQLSANLWRTVGTTVALTIGLGLFVTMQTWGYSMLAPFTPGDWAPDLVLTIAPVGIPDSEIAAVQRVPGVIPSKFLPLAVKQVKFAEDVTGYKVRPSATRQDNCVMVGLDPEVAFGGVDPLFKFEFVEGNRAEAIAKLKQGRFCLVPDHFVRESGLGIGQRFQVIPPDRTNTVVEYEIAGVVAMPGWHWISKVGFRRGRAAGLMFSGFDVVRNDFNTGRTTMFWGNKDGTASEDEIKASIQTIANRNFDAASARSTRRGPTEAGSGGGPGNVRREAQTATVTLRTAEGERAEIRGRADKIIWALSELPLITLLVTSLGVVNTVLSSIRSRSWELGVLRALGVTRFGLFRLIVAEALLIGVVACVLSLCFGTLAGYCGTGVTRYIDIRGGQVTPLIVPWAKLSVGFGIALGLCLVAAIWPALRTGRTEPLQLLQAGRSAT
jgi:putative ABC transport system permease protein